MIEEEIDVDSLLEDLKMNCGGFYPTGAYFLLLYNIMIVMMDVFTMSFTAWVPQDLMPNMKSSYPSHYQDVFPNICNETLRNEAMANSSDLTQLYPEIANQTENSIVAKFLIVCRGNEIFVNLTNTIFLVGIIVASFVSMPIADAIGRKPVLFASLWIMGLAHIIVIFSVDIDQYLVFRFICGVFHAGAAFCNLVMFGELFGTTHRFLTYLFSGLTLPFGLSCLALVGYLIREYIYMHVFFAILYGVTLITFWFVPESVVWLSTRKGRKNRKRILHVLGSELNGRLNNYLITKDENLRQEWHQLLKKQLKDKYVEEAEAVMANGVDKGHINMVAVNSEKGATNGNATGFTNAAADPTLSNLDNDDVPETATTRDTEKTWTWTLIKYLIIMCYCWGVVGWTFFGLIMSSNEVKGDRFLNFFVTVIVDLPGFLIAAAIGIWGSRRATLAFLYMTCGVPFLINAIIRSTMENQGNFDKDGCIGRQMEALSRNASFNESCNPDDHHDIRHDVLHGFHLIGHFGAGGSLLVIELITNEIFPTVARSTCFGICAAISRITAVGATFASILQRTNPIAFDSILIILNIGAAILLWFLPETRGLALPQTSADLDVFQDHYDARGGCVANICIGCLHKVENQDVEKIEGGKPQNGAANKAYEATE